MYWNSNVDIEIPVDATGSEVDVVLTATLGSTTLPTGMTATLASNSQTIAYSTATNAMKTNVRINIAWTGSESDTSEKDGTDLAAKGTPLSIPVTLTAKQSLTHHNP